MNIALWIFAYFICVFISYGLLRLDSRYVTKKRVWTRGDRRKSMALSLFLFWFVCIVFVLFILAKPIEIIMRGFGKFFQNYFNNEESVKF